MEIRKLCFYVIVNCAVIPYLSAKPFSLNEALAEESNQKTFNTPLSFPGDSPALSLSKVLTSDYLRNLKKSYSEYASIKTPDSKNKKTQQYKSLVYPSSLREYLKPLKFRRSLFRKREVIKNNNDKIDTKYTPIIKNLGLLLGTLLNFQPIDSYEISKNKYKHHKYQPQRRRGMVCKCALETDSKTKESRPYEETTIFARTLPITTTTSNSTTFNSTLGQHSNQGQIKNIPLLLPRDSRSDRRVSNGHSERNSATFYRNIQGNIARDIGDRKHVPRNEKEYSSSSFAKTTYSHPRDGTGSNEYQRRLDRGNPVPDDRNTTIKGMENTKANDFYGRISRENVTRDDKLQITGNEIKRQKLIPKHVRRFGRVLSANKKSDITKSIQPKDDCKKSFQDLTFTNANDKQIIDGNGPISTKASRASTNEQMISIKDLSNLKLALHKNKKMNSPSVSIIDGYSLTRHKNGQYKSL